MYNPQKKKNRHVKFHCFKRKENSVELEKIFVQTSSQSIRASLGSHLPRAKAPSVLSLIGLEPRVCRIEKCVRIWKNVRQTANKMFAFLPSTVSYLLKEVVQSLTECNRPVGVENRTMIADQQMSASSHWNQHYAFNARLHNHASISSSGELRWGGWCTDRLNNNQFLQVTNSSRIVFLYL